MSILDTRAQSRGDGDRGGGSEGGVEDTWRGGRVEGSDIQIRSSI